MERLVAGPIYRPGEGVAHGWLMLRDGAVVDEGDARPPRAPDAHGLVLPAPVDAHTHVGDRVARGIDMTGRTLAEVVAPPDGIKHRILRQTPRALLVEGMRAAVHEMIQAGSRAAIDFREGGLEGVRALREATPEGFRALAFARCAATWDDAEADAVAREADGIGLSALRDVAADVPRRAAQAARRNGKRFALHFSEAEREDVATALDLRPDFLVHGLACTKDDLDAIAAARVPVVVCPRSNALFGRAPPVPEMLAAGVELALGSDNAMFHPLDVLLDARLVHETHPRLPRERILDMAIAGGMRVLDGRSTPSWLHKGDDGACVVLAPQGREPLDAVFGREGLRRSWVSPAL